MSSKVITSTDKHQPEYWLLVLHLLYVALAEKKKIFHSIHSVFRLKTHVLLTSPETEQQQQDQMKVNPGHTVAKKKKLESLQLNYAE